MKKSAISSHFINNNSIEYAFASSSAWSSSSAAVIGGLQVYEDASAAAAVSLQLT